MKILQVVKKIPGGLTVVPLPLGATVNTLFGNVLWSAFDDTFTTYLWKSGAMPILVVFIFCNATTISLKRAGVTIYKGMFITAVKAGVGIIIGLICDTLFGEKGFLDLSTPAIVGALANSNDGLYAASAGEHGDAADAGVVPIPSTNDGPFSAMVALGAVGVAKISMSILIGCIAPVIVGYILGNLDEDIRKFCKPGTTMLIPLFALPLGAGLSIMNLLRAGGPGILLGVACTLITGLAGYLVCKLLCMDHPEVGGAIETAVGNTVVTPASIVAVDATLLATAEAATMQTTAAIIVTVILCFALVSYLYKIEVRKHGRQKNNRYYYE